MDNAKPGSMTTLDLRSYIPYRCSVVTNRVSACLEAMYSEKYGISVTGWRIMAFVGHHEPLSAKQVAQGTAMDQVQMTRALAQMSSLGLISRRTDPQDRRRIVLRLSRKGRTVYEEIIPLAKGLEDALLADFSDQEREALQRLSKKMMLRADEIFAEDVDWRAFLPD